MPVQRKRCHANNLGEYSKKRKLASNAPEPAHRCTPAVIHLSIPTKNNTLGCSDSDVCDFDIELESDSDQSEFDADDLDENSDNTSEWLSKIPLFECMCQAQKVLSHLIHERGTIVGNKVQYAGTTINRTPSERTRHRHAAKQRVVMQKVQEMAKKTKADQKKRTIHDFFHPPHKSNSSTPDPIVVSDSDADSDDSLLSMREITSQHLNGSNHPTPDNINPGTDDASESTRTSTPYPDTPINPSETPITSETYPKDPLPTQYHSHSFVAAPSREAAKESAERLSEIVQPHQNGPGHKKSNFDDLTCMRLEQILQLLRVYSSDRAGLVLDIGWICASEFVATSWDRGPSYAKRLHEWCHAFMVDSDDIPMNPYGKWKESILVMDDTKSRLTSVALVHTSRHWTLFNF
ncbi:uncharacterized protein EI90DRAFT_3131052 [Cantharellus anzutake]|uniref:uncharacterized protein n=1 Tax=Cantharellus anzutake TaxID=1750568 RepID=UPI00190822D6|nr:uncharacterized protein EI90DRAFT_3131052 [Cantharellus anzutake]KAF8322347.1 hypothetical protein EI90DRAFT_3131052 [Cantharellus anzutake]